MEHLILELLSEGGEMYGLELVSVSDGRLKRGTVYVTLGRMEEKGLVQSRLERPLTRGKVPQRRLYKPTSMGVRVLKAWRLLGRMLALEPIR
jgi:PadR family transcriptional regulator